MAEVSRAQGFLIVATRTPKGHLQGIELAGAHRDVKMRGYLPQSVASGAAQILLPSGKVSSPSYSKMPNLN